MKNVGARFRNRKINNKQLLHVYRAVDIPDLDESVSLQRSIPQTETGVDKEEESVSALTPCPYARHFFPRHSWQTSLPLFGHFFFPPFFYVCAMMFSTTMTIRRFFLLKNVDMTWVLPFLLPLVFIV